MSLNPKTRRRWLGGLCLLAAVVMLATGDTTPGKRLDGVTFVVYWLTCLILAGLALVTAIFDARAVRREAREAQRELLEKTVESIETEKANRSQSSKATK